MANRNLARFSVVGFAIALVAISVGTVAGLEFIPVVGSYVGMLLGGFVAGLAITDRPVLESGLAAGLAGLGLLAAGPLVGNGIGAVLTAFASIEPTVLLLSIALSFSVGAFGAHFGDDLRHGLTEPVEEPPSRSPSPGYATGVPMDEGVPADDRMATDESSVDNPSAGETRTSEPAESGSTNAVKRPDWDDDPASAESDESDVELEYEE